MLSRLGRAGQRWLRIDPWASSYGLARSLVALATAATLLLTPTGALLRTAGPAFSRGCSGSSAASIFCLVPTRHLGLARLLAGIALLVVASGWRPRLTGVLHWWITFSYFWTALTPQGGDQLASIITHLLIPVTLLDRRRWQWASSRTPAASASYAGTLCQLTALGTIVLIRIQVAAVYADSAVAKLGVQEWVDGTAIYYWLNDRNFGAPGYAHPLLGLLSHGWVVASLTWGTIILEMSIALSLIVRLPPRLRRSLFLAGMALHLAIALLMGLGAFSLVMMGALVLLFYPDASWHEVLGRRPRRAAPNASQSPQVAVPALRNVRKERTTVASSSGARPPPTA